MAGREQTQPRSCGGGDLLLQSLLVAVGGKGHTLSVGGGGFLSCILENVFEPISALSASVYGGNVFIYERKQNCGGR